MAPTAVLLCFLALFSQVIHSQFIGSPLKPGLSFNGPHNAFNNGPAVPGCGAIPSGGGGFAVTSTSPIAPTGVSVLAENLAIEGPLSIGGQLPFLGTVGLEGALPAYGSGAVSYGCGNGNIGINSEGLGNTGNPGSPAPFSLAGQNFGPNPAVPFGSLSNQPFAGLGPNGPAFGPGFAPNGLGFGSNGPGFGPNGPVFGSGLGFNGPL